MEYTVIVLGNLHSLYIAMNTIWILSVVNKFVNILTKMVLSEIFIQILLLMVLFMK